jgi:NAD(P)-dependent dehydrogenase (short-subunit alcohol dehydrogenase family)
MTFNFPGKRALLAGTLDTTLAVVGKTLHKGGAQIIVSDESPLWGDLPRETASLNMHNPDGLSGQIEALGAIDILVFNAAWRQVGRFLDSSPDDWDAAIQANFESPVFLAQAVAKAMIARGRGGRIIFLIGVEGLMPFAGTAAASVSLTMLWGIAKMIAVDLAPHGITANVVATGWTDSAALASLGVETQAHITRGIPIGQPGTPSDIGAAVAFLASDVAAYITGTVLPVDGGYLLTGSAGQTMFEP